MYTYIYFIYIYDNKKKKDYYFQYLYLHQKTGKWNAMHVRIAWEIYHHQQKQAAEVKAGVNVGGSKSDLLRPPTHLFPGPPRPHDLSSFAAPHRAPHVQFDNPTAHPPGPPFTNMSKSQYIIRPNLKFNVLNSNFNQTYNIFSRIFSLFITYLFIIHYLLLPYSFLIKENNINKTILCYIFLF